MRKTVFVTGLIFAGFIMLVLRSSVHAEETNTQTQTPQQVVVEIQKGDSLTKIADNHQTTYRRLYDANTFIQNPNIIYPGDKIRIPEASEQLQDRVQATQSPITAEPTTSKSKNKPPVSKPNNKPIAKKPITKQNTEPANIQPPRETAGDNTWDELARCESGGNWAINTGNGYYGGLQFTASTWKSVGGTGLPHQNSREEQIMRAQILQSRSGWGQWPACTKKLGLR